AALAKDKYRVEDLFPITVDVGQGQDEMEAAIQKASVLGITPIVVDAKEDIANLWLSKAIQANSNYEGYPVSTSMTRQLIASKIASLALKLGCDAVMEGSSGKGNDQYRMHNVFKLFAPKLDVLVPVRDFDLTRGEEEELSTELGIPITDVMQGGDDKTMRSRSLAAGVGLALHHDLEEFWLNKEELESKSLGDQKWGYLVYHGAWFSPLEEALDAFIQTTQAHVSGTETATLSHGTIDLESRQSDH